MDQLPTEVLANIFDRLKFKNRLQFALTCRYWHSKISSTVLYNNVFFGYRQKNATRHIKYMSENGLGDQITDLRIVMEDPLELSQLYPNLKSLKIYCWLGDDWDDKNNASLARNWNKLEAIDEAYYNCNEGRRTLVALKLLDASLHMMSLRTLTISLYCEKPEQVLAFFQQLKQAPALEYLKLITVRDLKYHWLDLLHENTANLNDLVLENVNFFFVENDNLEERRSLFTGLPICSKLRSFSANFGYNSGDQAYWEKYCVYWIEYICHKYPNLTSVTFKCGSSVLNNMYNQKIATDYLRQAFSSWTQLKKFDIQPVYLTTDVLHAMDDCNICLEELGVYVLEEEEEMEQFLELAGSQQGKLIHKLTINDGLDQDEEFNVNNDYEDDEPEPFPNPRDLIHYLQSLNKTNCQLKALDIQWPIPPNVQHDLLSPLQILDYVPFLQKMSMSWSGKREPDRRTYNQTTDLTHLDFELHTEDAIYSLQRVLYNSPSLQSISLDFPESIEGGIFLHLDRNTNLKYVKCHTQASLTRFIVVQNNQMKMRNPKTGVFEEGFPEDGYMYSIVLYLSPNVRSIVTGDEYRGDREYNL